MNLRERHTERVKRMQEDREELKDLIFFGPSAIIGLFATVWLMSAIAMIH